MIFPLVSNWSENNFFLLVICVTLLAYIHNFVISLPTEGEVDISTPFSTLTSNYYPKYLSK
jgi:hypothetical protein